MLSQPLFLSSKGWEEIYFVTNHVLDLAGLWPPPTRSHSWQLVWCCLAVLWPRAATPKDSAGRLEL